MKQPIPYQQARAIAIKICKEIEPFTTQCDIAGSIRREKPMIGDIEVLCVPRFTQVKDLFGEVTGTAINSNFVEVVNGLGKVVKGKPDGRYMQIELADGINLDLFLPQPHDYARMYCIRTGSSEYIKSKITTAWLQLGWCGTENGLRRKDECIKKDIGSGKHKWECVTKSPTLPPIWENELEFYKFLQLTWLEPQYRV